MSCNYHFVGGLIINGRGNTKMDEAPDLGYLETDHQIEPNCKVKTFYC